MNLQTNNEKLKKELEDIIRIFGDEFANCEFVHTIEVYQTKIINMFVVDGKEYPFCDKFTPTDAREDMREYKRTSKVALFSILQNKSSQRVPWGALTGIRPVKLFKSFEEKGENAEDIFSNRFFVEKEKVELVKKIFEVQKPIYSKSQKDINLYIGIPFCKSRCYYCSFLSERIDRLSPLVVESYVDKLCREISVAKETIKEGGFNLRSIYIGGGTPSSITTAQMQKMFEAIGNHDCEYTFEGGRADTLSTDKIALASNFANRISVNPQTANDETLKKIGRSHTFSDFLKAFEEARKYDFAINTDLICGLDGENFSHFENTMKKILPLSAENVTIHTLSLKMGSKYNEKVGLQKGEDISRMVEHAYFELQKAGYDPYYLYRQKYTADNLENCGFSKAGTECVYNIDIMEENTAIIACGAGSVSKIYQQEQNRIERLPLPKDIKTYLDKVESISQKRKEMFLNL